MAATDLIRTGIEGLDSVLLGGIPNHNSILIQGVVGSGKTVMGMEFIYRGATQFNEPGIIVVLRPARIRSFGTPLDSVGTWKNCGSRRS